MEILGFQNREIINILTINVICVGHNKKNPLSKCARQSGHLQIPVAYCRGGACIRHYLFMMQ